MPLDQLTPIRLQIRQLRQQLRWRRTCLEQLNLRLALEGVIGEQIIYRFPLPDEQDLISELRWRRFEAEVAEQIVERQLHVAMNKYHMLTLAEKVCGGLTCLTERIIAIA